MGYPQYAKAHQQQMELKTATIDIMEAALAGCIPLAKACGSYDTTCQSCNSPKTPDDRCLPPKDDPKGLPCCRDSMGVPCTNETLRFLACSNAYDACNLGELIPLQSTGINLYDVTKPCTVPPLCYDFSKETAWLNDKKNIAAIGAHGDSWTSCKRTVEIKLVFAGDWMLTFKDAIKSLLEGGVPVLIYHGENDIIVNWMGGQAWTNALKWSGSEGFAAAKNTTYVVGGEDSGSFKSFDGFTFMKLRSAGHLVPMDQPKVALDMLTKFLAGKPFSEADDHDTSVVV